MQRLPQLTLRDLFWLVALVAVATAVARGEPPDSASAATRRVSLVDPDEADWKRIESPEKVRLLQLLAFEKEESVNDASIERIVVFSNLEALSLGGPKLTDNALKPVLTLKKLRVIAIETGKFTDDGIQQLARLPGVEVIAFSDVTISDEALTKLKKALPSAEIESVHIGTSGKFHDANGCLTSEFLIRAKSRQR
jgi:hypothetical protein